MINKFDVADKLTAAHHGLLVDEPTGEGKNTGAAVELSRRQFYTIEVNSLFHF